MLKKLGEQTLPDSVRMILVLNPASSQRSPLNLPPSFLHVTLTTPYRSTIAITALARFVAECKGLDVPEEDYGSDVKGTKPIFFDVGEDQRKLGEALEGCQEHLKDNVTVLYDLYLPPRIEVIVKVKGKKAGGPWECHKASTFYGWEAERVVVVTNGDHIMELITRGRTHLAIILVDGGRNNQYAQFKKHFQQAECLGLVDVPLSDKENN